ncbi:MAG TPA: 4Fe-4S dicluster domain-containing protein [candidate division Zixibacteria bacterium]|nr:4Fe-4S dicluster domain-containing protein [candidate division Zixibacteria bacterium]
MLSKIITRQDLPKLIDALVKDYSVIAPTYEKNVPTFSEVKNSSEVEFSILFKEKLPMIPPKKIFLPANQTVFRYSLTEGITEGCGDISNSTFKKNIVLFGISPCDITGVGVLERIFKDNYSDDVFLKLRERTTIIGMNCLDHCYENCFCESMNSNDPKSGFDIMLTEISEQKLIAVPNSDNGKKILRQYNELFQEVHYYDINNYNKAIETKQKNFKREIQVEGLASHVEDSFESSLWEEFTDKCLFCGSCTFVCPTCYCYNVMDKVSINLKDGERQREWDSCYYPEFALVAGDHNFRERKAQRFRYRYLHKFVDLPRRYNFEGCVGCGRCITYCPTKIDVRDVLKKVRGES